MTNDISAPDAEQPPAMDNGDVVNVLNELLENCRDGENGFRACAAEVDSSATKQLLLARAAQCGQAEAELLHLVAAYGGKPAEGGTVAGALHRGWVHVTGALAGNNELAVLEACESGEDSGLALYRKALKQNLPADVVAVVQRQAEGAQRNHDQIQTMRNQARADD